MGLLAECACKCAGSLCSCGTVEAIREATACGCVLMVCFFVLRYMFKTE